jgi:hypothetical protein
MRFSPLLLIDVANIPGIGSGAAAAGGLGSGQASLFWH